MALSDSLPSVQTGASATVRSNAYLDAMEAAVAAYDDATLSAYLESVERSGVREHGFPRLAATLATLVANGRAQGRRETARRMMDVACRAAAKGVMPLRASGNEFSVQELVRAVEALEAAGTFPKAETDAWRAALTSVEAARCYTTGALPLGGPARNWVVFAAASEQARLRAGMGGDPAFVERYVADQMRWFDANGMYRDPHEPAMYDFVTRLQFASILDDGYDGASRAKLEETLDRAAEPTLRMISACGEIPYGGRSNQFLHNDTMCAALCEWYAARYAKAGDMEKAAAFRRAACAAMGSLKTWLARTPVSHIKNRYPRVGGGGSTAADIGCESYAYFDKYMITMGSWATLAWRFVSSAPAIVGEAPAARTPTADAFATTKAFHFVFLRAGDWSAQFDYTADGAYDADGLGRVHRIGAPTTLCLSTPCAKNPTYRVERPNTGALSFRPVAKGGAKLRHVRSYVEGGAAVSEWAFGATVWRCRLTADGLESVSEGKGPLTMSLPVFAFDGIETTAIRSTERAVSVSYGGWTCTFETDGALEDTGRTACNRNGRYRRFLARGEGVLRVRIRMERDGQVPPVR